MTLTTPARRSAPESFVTTALPSTMTAPLTAATPAPSRRRVWLAGIAALGLVGVLAAMTLGAETPVATPIPAPPVAAPIPAPPVSLVGVDPATSRCADDARTVTSRVVTLQTGGFEVPIGTLDIRSSAACGTAWARYTLAASAPVAAVVVEGTSRQEVPLRGDGRVALGVTPMVADDAPVRAELIPNDGVLLPSRAVGAGG